jgi:hypothetical protein
MAEQAPTNPGLFIVDLQSLGLAPTDLSKIEQAIQKAVRDTLATINDAEGFSGGPLGGTLAGFRAL